MIYNAWIAQKNFKQQYLWGPWPQLLMEKYFLCLKNTVTIRERFQIKSVYYLLARPRHVFLTYEKKDSYDASFG